jgi:RNA polymerase sigma-70 factor (ECF subfamily)
MLRNEDEALETAQETWVNSWQRLGQFHGGSSFGTWLMRILINLCLDQMRKRQRHPTESLEQLGWDSSAVQRQLTAPVSNPTESLERAELRLRIDAAIAQLSPDHRTVLVLHEFEEMPYKEIAKTIGCSIGTVMSRLYYARRRMARLLADQRGCGDCAARAGV